MITPEIIMAVLNHADAFILQFEQLRMITNVDFFSLYLAPLPDMPLPPIMELIASQTFAMDTANNIISHALNIANNTASQSLPALNNAVSQSLTIASQSLPVITEVASQSLNIANNVASQSLPVINNVASQSLELANAIASQSSGLSTEVFLTDEDLNELIRPLLEHLNNSGVRVISPEILESFGLYTNSVIAYLAKLGYIVR